MEFFITKLGLLVGSIVLFLLLKKIFKLPFEDPLYVLPLLVAIAWAMWSLHDMLWVVMGTLLDYKYILNMDTTKWGNYRSFQKFTIITMLIVLAITAWHFAWYFSNPSEH
jgi:hypothetical protein